jgi:hypothetical protein
MMWSWSRWRYSLLQLWIVVPFLLAFLALRQHRGRPGAA